MHVYCVVQSGFGEDIGADAMKNQILATDLGLKICKFQEETLTQEPRPAVGTFKKCHKNKACDWVALRHCLRSLCVGERLGAGWRARAGDTGVCTRVGAGSHTPLSPAERMLARPPPRSAAASAN